MQLQPHLKQPDTSSKEGKRLETLLVGLGRSLEKKFQSYKSQRDEKEREWIKAIRQYEGKWDADDLTKIEMALSMRGSRGTDPVSVNITRPKTNIAIARMKDIQFPTGGDFNFFLRPAPLSEEVKKALQAEEPDESMLGMAAQQGIDPSQVPAPKDVAQKVVEDQLARVPRMERKLRSRMIYADYGTKARLAIEDLCIKGSAVLKGPTIQHKKHAKYIEQTTQDGEAIQILEEVWAAEPTVQRVAPELFFPDPSARLPNEIEDCFELHPFSASGLIALAKNPSYLAGQIAQVLDADPDGSDEPNVIQETRNDSGQTTKNRYWLKEYRGPLDKNILFEAEMIDEDDLNDNLKQYTGEIWFVEKTVIRISLSHIEGQDELPYSIAVWEKDPNSVFGHGVPHLLRNAQRVVNQAYIMLLDNASLTSGPQIIMNKEMIIPMNNDEDYSIRPMKVWALTDFGVDVREAMQFVDIPAQMQGIAQIMDSAMQFADIESSTPLMHQGDVPSGNNTTSGLAMIMSATNIVQKAASMNWDDNITRPMVTRWYHYEMQHGEDPEVKGDMEVEVGGATERIEADIRSQEIERMLGLAGSNEEFMMEVDASKAFRALVDNTRTGDVLRTPAEVEQRKQEMQQQAAQQQEQDPNALKAQAAMITAQARMEEAKAQAQLNNSRQEMAAMEMQARYQGQIAEATARQNEATLNYQLGMNRLAAEKEKTLAQLQKDMQIADMSNQTKLNLKEIDFAKMEREIQVKEEFGEGI